MSEQNQHKALIVYASLTGNTEKVAKRFKQVFEKKERAWGDWECDIFKVSDDTYLGPIPYSFSNYDFICIGSPIWAGIPALYLFDDHIGALGKMLRPVVDESMKGNEPVRKSRKSIVFITYGGQGSGPAECLAGLEILSLYSGAKVVGKFACCGAQWDEPPLDAVASRFNWMVSDAAVAIDRYRINPKDSMFDKFSEDDHEIMLKAVNETVSFKTGLDDAKRIAPELRSWHYDFEHRPIERDLIKAEIFLEEILEDYYWGGIEKDPVVPNICIA